MPISAAVIQMEVAAGRVEESRRAALELTRVAIARGAKIVLLPEACLTDIYYGAQMLAETIPGPSTELFAGIAGAAVIALPLLERETARAGSPCYSSCALIDSSGPRQVARKTRLYRDEMFDESEVIAAGEQLTVERASSPVGRARTPVPLTLGVLLGSDAAFPESFQALAARGANLMLVPQNCVEPDLEFLRKMAAQHRVPLLVANRLGFRAIYPAVPEQSASALPILLDADGAAWVRCKGQSAIIGADGGFLAQPRGEVTADTAPADAPERVRIPARHFQGAEILTATLEWTGRTRGRGDAETR